MQGLATLFDRSWSALDYCLAAQQRRRRTGVERNRQWYSVSTPTDSTRFSREHTPFDDVNSHFVDQSEELGPVGIERVGLFLAWLPASPTTATTATTAGTARKAGASARVGWGWGAGQVR
jgi:hypothetical protein